MAELPKEVTCGVLGFFHGESGRRMMAGARDKICIMPVILFMLTFSGCASYHPPVKGMDNASPPDVSIGPEVELDDGGWFYPLSAIMDNDGRVHVIYEKIEHTAMGSAIFKGQYYLVFDERGVTRKEEIVEWKKSGWLDSLHDFDLAFDRRGNLHAISNKGHLVLRDGKWQRVEEPRCRWFGRGGKGLICAYEVKGEEVGSEDRWDLMGIPTPYPGIFIPISWHAYPTKFAIISETDSGWFRGLIVEPETKYDIKPTSISADDGGAIHLIYYNYNKTNPNIGDKEDFYLGIDPVTLGKDVDSSGRSVESSVAKGNGRALKSQKIERSNRRILDRTSTIADPETGIIPVITLTNTDIISNKPRQVNTCFINNGRVEKEVYFCEVSRGIQLAIRFSPAGKGKFHAVVAAPIHVQGGKHTISSIKTDDGRRLSESQRSFLPTVRPPKQSRPSFLIASAKPAYSIRNIWKKQKRMGCLPGG